MNWVPFLISMWTTLVIVAAVDDRSVVHRVFLPIWEGLKSAITWVLDPVFGFTRRERLRERLRDLENELMASRSAAEVARKENASLRSRLQWVVEGTPGAIQDQPQQPAWGTATRPKVESISLGLDDRYVRRLESDRDELRLKVKTLTEANVEAAGAMRRTLQELDLLQAEIAQMRREGVLPMVAKFTETSTLPDPPSEFDIEFFRRKEEQARSRPSITLTSHAGDPLPKWGVMDRQMVATDTFCVVVEFRSREHDPDRTAFAIAARQATRDDCLLVPESIQRESSVWAGDSKHLTVYRYSFREMKKVEGWA